MKGATSYTDTLRKLLLMGMIVWGLCVATSAKASEESRSAVAPNDEAIFAATIDANSPFYYPPLFTRYMEVDTTLTLEEYQHLYYGYLWQPTYRPHESPRAYTTLLSIFEKPTDSLTTLDCERIIELTDRVMTTEPFNPSTINFRVFAYGAMGDTLNERKEYQRLQMLFETILSSGDGIHEKSPWHVLYFSHAADVMAHMGLAYGKRMVVSRTTEFIPLLERTSEGIRGFYFHYGRIYQNQPEQIPEHAKRPMQINGITINKQN